MAKIDKNFFDIGYMDTLSQGDTPLHRLDPRAKLITTLVFITVVLSFGKYEIAALIPFFIYPVALVAAGNLPAGHILKKILVVSPFAVLIGAFNPLMDRDILVHIGQMEISGGWVSFLSVLIRFFLTVGAALTLIALTGFTAVCMALEKLGVPQAFVVQLLLLYRYLFVLVDEAARMVRARVTSDLQFKRNGNPNVRTHARSFAAPDRGPCSTHTFGHVLPRVQRSHSYHQAPQVRCQGNRIHSILDFPIFPFTSI